MMSMLFTSSTSTSSSALLKVSCYSHQRRHSSSDFSKDYLPHPFHNNLSAMFKQKKLVQELPSMQSEVQKTIKSTSVKVMDAFIDSVFQFVDNSLLPYQRNFGPARELEGPVLITNIVGYIPDNFPEGAYLRNGPNHSHIWLEREGMLHGLYFYRENDGTWTVLYRNRHVESYPYNYKLVNQRNNMSYLPSVEADSPAILSAYILNLVGLPLTSYPKKAPVTGEMVITRLKGRKPFVELGVISVDGKKVVHKADLKLDRRSFCHELGVTQRYNVILDLPLAIDSDRLNVRGGLSVKYNKEEYSRIGVMPRYGDGDTIQWFDVQPNCTIHIFNCFENGEDEVVVRGCRAIDSIVPGLEKGLNEFELYSKRLKQPIDESSGEGLLLSSAYEWRLNMKSREVKERNLVGMESAMNFPIINGCFTGLKNKYGYAQVVDFDASSSSGMAKYGGLAKLHFEQPKHLVKEEKIIKVEHHMFEKNCFCSGATFVPKEGGVKEDDGWIITFVHNENSDISQVYVIDAKKFTGEPIARMTLPYSVPCGSHSAFMPISCENCLKDILDSM